MKNIIYILGIIVIGGAVLYITTFPESGEEVVVSNDTIVEPIESEESEDVPEEFEDEETASSEDESSSSIEEEPTIQAASGTYAEYDEALISADGNTVIFFAASWCPSCRALDNSIIESSSDIPSDLTILKADYDTENDLRRKYSVTNQHTLVQVDANGDLINKWSGGSTLNSIVSKVQ